MFRKMTVTGKIFLKSPIVINVPTRASLAVETKGLLLLLLAHLNNESNVCKRMLYLPYKVKIKPI